MSTPSSSSLNYTMPVVLPPGFATPTPPSTPYPDLMERVLELEIENDRLKTGMHNFNVDRNEADDRIDSLQQQVDDLIGLVAALMAPQQVGG